MNSPLPSWLTAVAIAGVAVWAASLYSETAAWYLAVLIVLSVLVMRPGAMAELQRFVAKALGR